jgi:hypothetical protein
VLHAQAKLLPSSFFYICLYSLSLTETIKYLYFLFDDTNSNESNELVFIMAVRSADEVILAIRRTFATVTVPAYSMSSLPH